MIQMFPKLMLGVCTRMFRLQRVQMRVAERSCDWWHRSAGTIVVQVVVHAATAVPLQLRRVQSVRCNALAHAHPAPYVALLATKNTWSRRTKLLQRVQRPIVKVFRRLVLAWSMQSHGQSRDVAPGAALISVDLVGPCAPRELQRVGAAPRSQHARRQVLVAFGPKAHDRLVVRRGQRVVVLERHLVRIDGAPLKRDDVVVIRVHCHRQPLVQPTRRRHMQVGQVCAVSQ